MEKSRERFVFRGRVQGVGFRFKLQHLAEYRGLTGWVENEYDGSVRAELQGYDTDIDFAIQSLLNDRYIQIEDMERKSIPLEEDERRFKARYY